MITSCNRPSDTKNRTYLFIGDEVVHVSGVGWEGVRREERGGLEEEGRSLNISTLPTVIDRCIRTSPVAFCSKTDNTRYGDVIICPRHQYM